MPALILYMVAGALIVLFASQNLDMVTVYVIVASFQAPLILIIGISVIMGFIAAIMTVIRKAVKSNTRKIGAKQLRF